jgi:ABC-type nitrate/sulfonate/bicarbonate transport system ATPase subunit
MRQRVAVGRAIANNSRILLLDEPFSALDYMTKQTMQKFIQDIQQEFKKTVIFVTHNFDDAYMTSDQVIVLDPINHQVIYIDNPKKARYIGDTPYI